MYLQDQVPLRKNQNLLVDNRHRRLVTKTLVLHSLFDSVCFANLFQGILLLSTRIDGWTAARLNMCHGHRNTDHPLRSLLGLFSFFEFVHRNRHRCFLFARLAHVNG